MTDTATTRVYTHVRAGNRARVYLKRPWFSSGEDEFLGVVASADDIGVNIPQSAEPYLTRVANDVIWPALGQPRAAGYPRARRFRDALDANALNAIRGQGGLVGVPLPLEEAGGHPVDVVCHRVQYNPTRKLWFADITVDPNDPSPTYSPFLKLALVRYQPFALDGLHVSPLIAADSVQLAPDRTTKVTVNKNVNQIEVEVRGTFLPDSSVTVSLERPRSFVPDEHIGWVAGPVTDEPLTSEGDGPEKVWRKTLPLGALLEYRVAVKEVESHMSDAGPYKRLVYADIFRSNE
ncbi:MAG TPA: hypothetical protein VD861_07530 [Pyrinomonadaceae bacterium]|nr:hypothetical protein [Pyrinomonadaceae bacterium]